MASTNKHVCKHCDESGSTYEVFDIWGVGEGRCFVCSANIKVHGWICARLCAMLWKRWKLHNKYSSRPSHSDWYHLRGWGCYLNQLRSLPLAKGDVRLDWMCLSVTLSSGEDDKHTSNKVGVLLASTISARRFLGTPSSSRMCTKFSKRHTRPNCLIFSSPYTRSINPSDGSLFGAACCLSGNVFGSCSRCNPQAGRGLSLIHI